MKEIGYVELSFFAWNTISSIKSQSVKPLKDEWEFFHSVVERKKKTTVNFFKFAWKETKIVKKKKVEEKGKQKVFL